MIAVVIPSCGGKTSLANKLNVHDIDVGAMDNKLGRTVRYLTKLAIADIVPWNLTNTVQWNFIKEAAQTFDSTDSIVLLHSYEAAEFINASRVHACIPSDNLHNQAIINRGEHMRVVAFMNKQQVIRDILKFDSVLKYESYDELCSYMLDVVGAKCLVPDSKSKNGKIEKGKDKVIQKWLNV